MVKIEIISPGAAATILRNGVRQEVFVKQLITYQEADSLEVTGGDVVYSINETEVVTKSGNAAPAVPQAAPEPELPVTEASAEEVKPVIVQPAAKTTKAK